MVACIASVIVYPEEWEFTESVDDFTDERVSIASIDSTKGEHEFSLFVNCKDKENLNIGITGTYINPVGKTDNDTFEIPVRFDPYEPRTEYFVKQGDILLYKMHPRFKKVLVLTAETAEEAESTVSVVSKRMEQIFVKKLASATRLRIKFPQYPNDTTLFFSLAGAKKALVSLANACKTELVGGTEVFVNEKGTEYATFVEMLQDDTWANRYEYWVSQIENLDPSHGEDEKP